jgi:hypothetical protein
MRFHDPQTYAQVSAEKEPNHERVDDNEIAGFFTLWRFH